LLLFSSNIIQDTNILGKDVLPSANDCHGRVMEVLDFTGHKDFKLGEDIPDFETFLEVIILLASMSCRYLAW